ncbi:MAG: arsenite methyltransferase, partial [Firmicutes bacterium]|nr:arsenite methyltransferase [Bacillota bacterium]
MRDENAIVEAVREHYEGVARRAARANGECVSSGCGCSSGGECCAGAPDYTPEERASLPAQALAASAGCGNPGALADLHPGEVVLDLGSGGGIDGLLSARRVGPGGHAGGVDMTREMLELAEANRRRSGLDNVGFLEGRIEALPLPDASVDVVISNCVINLSVDKAAVLREAARVLRPGGRLAVYDIVAHEPLTAEARRDLRAWSQCVAGALDRETYVRLLHEAGFVDVEVRPVATQQAGGCCGGEGPLPVGSAFVRARKPGSPDLGDGRLSVEAASREDLPAILHLLEAVGLPTEGVADGLDGFVVAPRR